MRYALVLMLLAAGCAGQEHAESVASQVAACDEDALRGATLDVLNGYGFKNGAPTPAAIVKLERWIATLPDDCVRERYQGWIYYAERRRSSEVERARLTARGDALRPALPRPPDSMRDPWP